MRMTDEERKLLDQFALALTNNIGTIIDKCCRNTDDEMAMFKIVWDCAYGMIVQRRQMLK